MDISTPDQLIARIKVTAQGTRELTSKITTAGGVPQVPPVVAPPPATPSAPPAPQAGA